MKDLYYVLGTLGLFLIAALFVMACDRIVGPDEEVLAEEGPESVQAAADASRARA